MKIHGTKISNSILIDHRAQVTRLKKKGITPHLAVILVGNDPSSVSYVNQKEIKGEKIGARITVHQLPTSASTKSILSLLNDLNHLTSVHGIIVQRPLPQNINSNIISLAISPEKDIDGFHPKSPLAPRLRRAGKFQPPIALAVLRVLRKIFSKHSPRGWPNGLPRGGFSEWLISNKIVVIGKGETGGKPIIETFKKMSIKPKVIDSKTPNSENLTKTADIIISAVGKANIISPEMIKKGVILISVGLHKGKDGKLHGDYEEEEIKNIASFYTPTPSGVGPVNVAMLLQNLVEAAENTIS